MSPHARVSDSTYVAAALLILDVAVCLAVAVLLRQVEVEKVDGV